MMPDIAGPRVRDDQPGPGRYSQRPREVALQKIIEAIALTRITRAMRTVTSASGEELDYKIGELVDVWREPAEKDASGWHGPAKIVAVHIDRGLVEVTYRKDQPLRVKFGDVRRFMDFAALILVR